jgi:hypothetical protein
MINAEQLVAAAQATGKQPAWIAYTMTTQTPWPLGYLAFVAQRWSEVAESFGMRYEDLTSELKPMFATQFVERCAAFVREKYAR